jgi:hypothetical protein
MDGASTPFPLKEEYKRCFSSSPWLNGFKIDSPVIFWLL